MFFIGDVFLIGLVEKISDIPTYIKEVGTIVTCNASFVDSNTDLAFCGIL